MGTNNYWAGIAQQRLSRRRALEATGTVAGAAAFLAACERARNGLKDATACDDELLRHSNPPDCVRR